MPDFYHAVIDQGITPAEPPESPPPWAWYGPLLDFLLIVCRWKLVIAAVYAVILAATFAYLYTQQPLYTSSANAAILPRTSPILNARLTTSSFVLPEMDGKSGMPEFSLPSRPELFVELLQSAHVLDAVATRVGLTAWDGSMIWPISSYLRVETTDDGLLTVAMRHPDAKMAASIVNACLDETVRAARQIESQILQQQVAWLENAVAITQKEENEKEQALRAYQSETGGLDPSNESPALVTYAQNLRTSLASAKVRLQKLLESRTDADPEVKILRKEIASFEELLSANGQFEPHMLKDGDSVSVRALKLDRLKREARSAHDLAEALALRLTVYRLQLNAPPSGIAILQKAGPATKASVPMVKRILIGGIGGGAVLSFLAALVLDQYVRLRRNPALQPKLQLIRRNAGSWMPQL